MCVRAISTAFLLYAFLLPSWGAALQELNLDDLVAEVCARNPEILAAREKYEAAQQRPSQVASLPDPVFSPGWSSAGNPLPGAGLGTNVMSNIGFSVTQQIPSAGKRRLRGDLAGKEADAAYQEFQAIQLSVVSRVKQAYYRLQHSYSAEDVLERNRDLLRNLLSLTEISYTSGKAQQQDVFKAQLQVSLLETRIVQIQRERKLREVELNTLVQRNAESPLGRPAEPRFMPISKSLAELQAAARETSPLPAREHKMTERAETAVELARRDYYPDYSVSGGYYNQGTMPPFYTVRADVNIPLYFRSKQRAALREQILQLEQSRHSYEATRQTIGLRVVDDYSSAETSLQLLNLYTNTVLPQARLSIDSATLSYEHGKLDFLSVLNNYTAALEYEMDYHEQMLNYHLAIARLEEETGLQLVTGGHK